MRTVPILLYAFRYRKTGHPFGMPLDVARTTFEVKGNPICSSKCLGSRSERPTVAARGAPQRRRNSSNGAWSSAASHDYLPQIDTIMNFQQPTTLTIKEHAHRASQPTTILKIRTSHFRTPYATKGKTYRMLRPAHYKALISAYIQICNRCKIPRHLPTRISHHGKETLTCTDRILHTFIKQTTCASRRLVIITTHWIHLACFFARTRHT